MAYIYAVYAHCSLFNLISISILVSISVFPLAWYVWFFVCDDDAAVAGTGAAASALNAAVVVSHKSHNVFLMLMKVIIFHAQSITLVFTLHGIAVHRIASHCNVV